MRLLLAAITAGVALAPALADDLPKGGGTIQMLIAKVEGDKLVTSTSSETPRTVTVTSKDGSETKTITVTETTTTTVARDLKYLRASGPDGKEVPAAEWKDRLKGGGLVVFLTGSLDPSWKAKFKKGTLFVEYAAPDEEPAKGDATKPADK